MFVADYRRLRGSPTRCVCSVFLRFACLIFYVPMCFPYLHCSVSLCTILISPPGVLLLGDSFIKRFHRYVGDSYRHPEISIGMDFLLRITTHFGILEMPTRPRVIPSFPYFIQYLKCFLLREHVLPSFNLNCFFFSLVDQSSTFTCDPSPRFYLL